MTHKKIPSYNLDSIKKAFKTEDKLYMTVSAKQGQIALGFSDSDVVKVIQNLSSVDFYKSMEPLKAGFTAWQDVYKPSFRGVRLYVKFQVNTRGELILSFKEK